MNGLKKFGLGISVALFGPLFLLSVFSIAFNRTLGDQEYTKQVIESAGFYSSVGETIKSQAVGEAGTDPIIESALNSAVSGENLQNTLEPLLDGTYGWLSGETQQPEFSLAIEPIKANFQESLRAGLQARASSLPTCASYGQLQGEDIFTYTCIPPGTDVNATINDAVTRITNNASVFSDEVVADGTVSTEEAQDLGINDPTQNLPNTLPQLYQFLAKGQWFFIAGALLATISTVLLSLTWLHGLRKLGVLLLINGLLVLVIGLVMSFIVGSLIPTTSVEVTESTVNAIEKTSKAILGDNASVLKLVGIISTLIGVAAVITSSVLLGKRKKPESTPLPPSTPPTKSKTTTP